jgi:beta-galactosidase
MSRGLKSLSICLSLLLGIVSCRSQQPEASNPGDGVESGELMLTTTSVPSDVKCIVLTAVGPGATVTRSFDVTPSQSASMSATGLPTGSVTLSEGAYNATCSSVTAQTPLTWVSAAPVVVQLVAGQSTAVSIELRRPGGASITTTFNDGLETPPTIATPASATPNPVVGTTTALSVMGADDNGEAKLVYTWATTGTPPAAVTFSSNGTNASKATTATFAAPGTYTFQVTVKDQANLTAVSATSVTVTSKITTIVVSPSASYVSISGTQQFTAVARDQFSAAMSPQPAFTWTVSGGGTISTSGLFTAGTTAGGPYAVTPTGGGATGIANVTVLPAPTQAPVYQIDSGSSSAVAPFSADTYGSGGTTHSVTNTITTSGVTNAAPAAVYQTERYGAVTYTLPNLVAGAQYVVRLHFAELYWTATGKRVFNVSINGTAVLSSFDIYAAAGAQYKAVVRDFTATANSSGQIVLALTTVTDNASINGVEVLGLKYANGAACSQASQCQSGTCTSGMCLGTCGSCGTGKVCDSVGNCLACTTGTACDTSNSCQLQTTAVSCTTATNQCFATGNKPAGTICGASGAGQTCDSSGNCTCAFGSLACGRCQGWNFESGSISGWSTNNGAVQVGSGAGKGSYSLAVTGVNIDGTIVDDVSITVTLCTASSIPIEGTIVNFDAKAVGTNGLGFGSDGAGGGGPGVLVDPDGGEGGSWLVYQGLPMTSGTWYSMGPFTMRGYSGHPNMTTLSLRFHSGGNPWSGTIYLDNISLTR